MDAPDWLDAVAAAAGRDTGAPPELLGLYLRLLLDAATDGQTPDPPELDAVGLLGRRAAELGVPVGAAVALYLSAARKLWRRCSSAARSAAGPTSTAAVLQVVDEAVQRLAQGHAQARRQMAGRDEALRNGLVEDLLRGDADAGRLVERAEPFGLDLARAHQVLLAATTRSVLKASMGASAPVAAVEHAIVRQIGDRDVLVAAKDDWTVVIAPPDRSTCASIGDVVLDAVNRCDPDGSWRVAIGRAYPGSYGIARSYEEAREALSMATRLRLDTELIRVEQLLVHRVLLRDRPAMSDLIESVLGGLLAARGGAEPLLATLEAYFATGGTITETARRLNLSPRTITYRLDRIRILTGHDATDPHQRFTINAAVVGAQMLGWPDGVDA